MQTAERSSGHDPSEQVIFNRCLFAYVAASEIVRGDVIELGSGEGYGIEYLADHAGKYLAIDKYDSTLPEKSHVEFRKMKLPRLEGIADNLFDFAVSFQVIEHIQDDLEFIKEIHRVLKPGGKLLLTTPNRLMSLSRNPWHIREYTGEELKQRCELVFSKAELMGVFANQKVDAYHEKNRASVDRLMRYDIFKLQYRLPRWMLRIPYDLLNRINRRKLLSEDTSLVNDITTSDFELRPFSDKAYDLFIIAAK